jgi:hypothetical protein
MKMNYAITDKSGKKIKTGIFTEPELRMAAKAGFRVFEINAAGAKQEIEITQGLTGLFNGYNDDFDPKPKHFY